MASTLLSPPPPSSGAADPITGSSDPASSFVPSLLVIAALLAFVLLASVSIHLLLRLFSRSSPPLPRTRREEHSVEAADASVRHGVAEVKKEGRDEKQRMIESLPLFTMASSLAALPKSSPDCAVCLSPFTLDAELRLLPACRHAFHAVCVDAWLRTTPSCPLCRATVTLPHPSISAILAAEQPPPPEPRRRDRSRSFRVEMGSVSNRSSSMAPSGGNSRATYSLGSFDYHIDEEVEAVVSRAAPTAARSIAVFKEDKPATEQSPSPPGEAVAEAAGVPRSWLREYVDRLASSASSLSFSGRWSSRWSQSHQSHQSQRQEEPWLWDAEAVRMSPPGTDEEETAFMVLYRWISGV
ncbi:hypothetical protein ABZP36_004376 [Zizania latifolia]